MSDDQDRELRPYQCANFTEYQEFELEENGNLNYGDGDCSFLGYNIGTEYSCRGCRGYVQRDE